MSYNPVFPQRDIQTFPQPAFPSLQHHSNEILSSAPSFNVVAVKDICKDKCLVQWKDTKVSIDIWESYLKIVYKDDADIIYIYENYVHIIWKNTWIDLSKELLEMYERGVYRCNQNSMD